MQTNTCQISLNTRRVSVTLLERNGAQILCSVINTWAAEITTLGFKRPYKFSVSFYQVVILTLLNSTSELTMTELQELSWIPEKDLEKHLACLCYPRKKLVAKSNVKKSGFNLDEKLKINANFLNKHQTIRFIPIVDFKIEEDWTTLIRLQNQANQQISPVNLIDLELKILTILQAK